MRGPRRALTRIAAAAALLLLSGGAGPSAPARASADAARYQKILLSWPGETERAILGRYPELEAMGLDPGESVTYLSRPAVTDALRAAGLAVEVLEEDLQARYVARMAGGGPHGDFFSYAEAVAYLDSMHTAYPAITTAKDSIGAGWEGRAIWAIKVSDNPEEDEDEPEVLLDALHHAREAATVSVALGFLRHLCEGYGTDSEATWLVDHREIWIVAVVNPDGFVYNESIAPGGGGLWRKNRRDNPGDCEGVDLNRNYSFEWGGAGSDADSCSEVYRGPAPFSEPESQAMRDFIAGREFATHDSYHSVVPIILFPWGYTTAQSPDHALFSSLAAERARDNRYPYGNAGLALYLASGTTFDWTYGDTLAKPRIYSFTTEVSGGDFWPPESAIPGIVAENIHSIEFLARVAGSHVRATQSAVLGGDGDGALDPGESVDLVVTLQNAGVRDAALGVRLRLATDDPYVELQDAVSDYGLLGAGASATNDADPFALTVDPATPAGHVASFRLLATWDAGANEETVTLAVGSLPVLVSHDFEGANPGYTQDPSHTAPQGAWVIVDPNPTDFQPGDDTTPAPGVRAYITGQNIGVNNGDVDAGVAALRSPLFNLAGQGSVVLALNWFHGQQDFGDDPNDFFRIDLSNDGGASWPANLLTVGDVSTTPAWTHLEVPLEDHLPLTAQMRLRFQASDGVGLADIIEAGIDDLFLLDAGEANDPPGAPELASPPDGAVVANPAPALVVANAADADGDGLDYAFRVYGDSLLTTVVASASGVAEGAGQTSWTVAPPLAEGNYWWRAHADDGLERGAWMAAARFTVAPATGVPQGGAGAAFALHPARPNPFAAETTVRFSLPRAGRVSADVFDATGRRVRALHRGLMEAGMRTLSWDGRDESGAHSAAGVYFLVLHTDGETRTLKLTLAR